MNFVLIISDTLRWDHLGASGNDWIRTPNLDRLAAESLVFDRAYTGSFPTIPHRTDVVTGKYCYPLRGWSPLPQDEAILSETLTDAGYTTMLVCDTPHLARDGHCFDRGYKGWKWFRGQESDRAITDDVPFEMPCATGKIRNPDRMIRNHYRLRARYWQTERDTFAGRTFQYAADWVELNYTHEKFFLHVDAFDPHEPWDPPRHYVDMYDPGYAGEILDHPLYGRLEELGATEAEIRHMAALYAGEVTLVDTWVGRLLEKLDHCGQIDNTVIVFHSDHGHYVGDHGLVGKSQHDKREGEWPYYEEVSHVPLMIRAPEGPRGERHSFLAQGVDIMPTILELAGIETPEGLQGTSLAPALRGEALPERPVALTTQALTNPENLWRLCTSVTDGTWTLHYRGSESPWQLYNVVENPAQDRDLGPTHRAEAERLHALHVKELERVGVREEVIAARNRLP